ncbi:uncharacterized protein BX663DRAFT_514298 [Cokeromyces recurvatus]|uniref:uncharacterized protein n=1 Tax=Cokeromyces recurvatus TaxID=90255 RepID=UPI00221F0021|nr:uncharacterized protein BX663DRAFT_514298 [Cokeromyces recurvatus]KAI7901388.1 hypothetical protein BX663DRAFT_514298 [Cokeromyces recurvatus]
MEEVVDSLVEVFKEVAIIISQRYKKYGEGQVDHFINLVQEFSLLIPKEAEQCGIPCSYAEAFK